MSLSSDDSAVVHAQVRQALTSTLLVESHWRIAHHDCAGLLLELLLELELDELLRELFEEEFDELLPAVVRPGVVSPSAWAARFMPRSQPPKKPCTALSPRAPLLLEFDELLREELLLELLDELLEELLEELELELLEELLDELLDEFELLLLDELLLLLPDEFDEEFELELPAEKRIGVLPSSASMASRPAALTASGSPCEWAPEVAMRPATVVAIMRCLVFMRRLRSGMDRRSMPAAAVRRIDLRVFTTPSRAPLFRPRCKAV